MANELIEVKVSVFVFAGFVIVVGLVLILLGAIVTVYFSSWINSIIDNKIILRNGSQTFGWWRKPPVEPVIRIYVYNVTNPEEFLYEGKKPMLDELGPYVYEEVWEKVNLRINDNNTITFNQRKTFKFVPELSVGDLEDVVVVPNIPMLSATSQSKHAARFLRLAMASIMDILKIRPFVEVPVGKLLWGYEDPLLKLAKDVVPKEQKLPYEEFGLMYGKNSTSADNVTVFTGGNDIRQFGLIDKFNGLSHLTHWKTEKCNRLNGSDGSIFPPHITPNTTLYVYEKDLCRLLPLRFLQEVETAGGVKGYRFTPPKDVFADVAKNPENDCFCPSGPPCSPNGLFNISLCQFDSPIMLSFPHFYLADPKLRDAVEGMSPPDPEKHQLYIDVQPQMGVALGARARIQLNLAVSQVVDIKQVATFPDIVFPIMWFEEGIDHLPEEVTDMLSLATNAPPIARAVIAYGLFALGIVLLVIAVTCLIRSSGRQETLNLEGTSHYVKPEKKPPTTTGHPDATNGHTNGKGKTLETLNPAFVGGPENGVTNQ
ncbi:Scavenger receptor class B member 1 [Zootermopsis nevadensis]|uniref:Scavenger receptor class B member 1 n=1 Tax=Zootermopsis nevadensis TaxID=136037 RepID=A0A067R9W5_ZOONE|nr:Scavenger receptor class B member 1 [Zootermopsis nevadensis]